MAGAVPGDVALLAQEVGVHLDQDPTAEAVVFWIFGVIAVGSAIAVISMRNIVHAALMLVVNLLSIAVLYLALQSQFLGIIQVLVYAGAIMVLFLFVIMLLGVDRDDLLFATRGWHRVGAVIAGAAVAAGLLFAFGGAFSDAARCGAETTTDPVATSDFTCAGLEETLAEEDEGSVSFLGGRMFTRWTFPFEAAALLLVVATIGAIILGRRRDPDPVPTGGAVTAGGPGPLPADEDVEEPGRSTPEGTPSDADRLLPGREEEGR